MFCLSKCRCVTLRWNSARSSPGRRTKEREMPSGTRSESRMMPAEGADGAAVAEDEEGAAALVIVFLFKA